MPSRSSFLFIAIALLSAVGEVFAADEAQIVPLAITPATEPVPSLQYQLLPKHLDRRPGNAAVRYERAALQYRPEAKVDTDVAEWLDLPFAEFAQPAQLKKMSTESEKVFAELRRASQLESCHWELPLREQMFFEILLPEVQELRRLARYVALKARREIATKRFDEAVATLQVGYGLARHTAEGPTLIHGLVGVSITGLMNSVLFDLAQSPGAPSLYWALTFQPRPLIDLRPGMEAEMSGLFLSFSELINIGREDSGTVDAPAAVNRLIDTLTGMSGMIEGSPPGGEIIKLSSKVALYAMAAVRKLEMQDYLKACRWPAARVDKLSDAELLLAFTRVKYEELRDLQFRLLSLPYWQTTAGSAAANERLRSAGKKFEEVLPFAALILPAVGSVHHSSAKSERRLDVLRIVEALRLYAGKHDGALPPSLDAVTDVPVPPLDLITGKPFVYALAGKTARLTLPDENRGEKKTLVYEITVQGK